MHVCVLLLDGRSAYIRTRFLTTTKLPPRVISTASGYEQSDVQCCSQSDTARCCFDARGAVQLVAKIHAEAEQHGEKEVGQNLRKRVLRVVLDLLSRTELRRVALASILLPGLAVAFSISRHSLSLVTIKVEDTPEEIETGGASGIVGAILLPILMLGAILAFYYCDWNRCRVCDENPPATVHSEITLNVEVRN